MADDFLVPPPVPARRIRPQTIMIAGFVAIFGLLIASVLIWVASITEYSANLQSLSSQHTQSRRLAGLRELAQQRSAALYRGIDPADAAERETAAAQHRTLQDAFAAERDGDPPAHRSADEEHLWEQAGEMLAASARAQAEALDAAARGAIAEAQAILTQRVIPLQERFNRDLGELLNMHASALDAHLQKAGIVSETAFTLVFVLSGAALLFGVLMIFILRRTARTENALIRQGERIRVLYEVTSAPGASPEDQIQQLLREGCRLLDLEIAKLTRVDPEARIVTFVQTWCIPELDVKPGTQVPIGKTFCNIVFHTDRGIAVSNVTRSEYNTAPCHDFSRLESYIAAPIWVDGKRWGTVNFGSRSPRREPFTATDQDLVNLIGRKMASILERRRTQDILVAKEAAEASSRTKSEFLASMSHELRTPLNAIIGYSELLIDEARENGAEKTLPDLNRIRYAGVYLLSLIDDVLDFSKIESGKIELTFEYIEAKRLLNEVAESVKPLMQKNGNAFKVNIDASLGIVYCDVKRMRQILFNLLSNAAKFTQSGTVTLDARREGGAQGEYAVFRVSDTGIGIDPVKLGQLFKPFSQADQTIARKYGGTGLGLVISRRFSQMMGGDITVQSESGKGSVFTVTLPTDTQRRKRAAAQ